MTTSCLVCFLLPKYALTLTVAMLTGTLASPPHRMHKVFRFRSVLFSTNSIISFMVIYFGMGLVIWLNFMNFFFVVFEGVRHSLPRFVPCRNRVGCVWWGWCGAEPSRTETALRGWGGDHQQ